MNKENKQKKELEINKLLYSEFFKNHFTEVFLTYKKLYTLNVYNSMSL